MWRLPSKRERALRQAILDHEDRLLSLEIALSRIHGRIGVTEREKRRKDAETRLAEIELGGKAIAARDSSGKLHMLDEEAVD